MSEEAAAPAEGGQGEATPQPEASAPSEAPSPTASIADDDLRGWMEAKFNGAEPTLEKVASSYRNLEKLVGAEKADRTVTLPGPDAPETEVDAFYQRLGRPEKADGYELPIPEGDDGKMGEWASGVFHKAGLSQKQAATVAEAWNEYVASTQGEAAQKNQHDAQQAEAALKKEWGAAYDQKIAGIDRAAISLGMNEEQLEGLRSAMGPVAAMKFVDSLATKTGEAPIDMEGNPSETGMMTPGAARQELGRLGTDKDFMEAWMNKNHPSHQWAVDKKQRLAKMAAGNAA